MWWRLASCYEKLDRFVINCVSPKEHWNLKYKLYRFQCSGCLSNGTLLQLYGEFLDSTNYWRESAELSPKLKERLEKVILIAAKREGNQFSWAENEVDSMKQMIQTHGTRYCRWNQQYTHLFAITPLLVLFFNWRTLCVLSIKDMMTDEWRCNGEYAICLWPKSQKPRYSPTCMAYFMFVELLGTAIFNRHSVFEANSNSDIVQFVE